MHFWKFEKTVQNAASDGVGSNFNGAAFCLPASWQASCSSLLWDYLYHFLYNFRELFWVSQTVFELGQQYTDYLRHRESLIDWLNLTSNNSTKVHSLGVITSLGLVIYTSLHYTSQEQHIRAASCSSRLESQWEAPNFDPPWSQNYWGDRAENWQD